MTLDEINFLIKDTNIMLHEFEETSDGISDTTYLGISNKKDKYIFKLFENSSKIDIENKISILNSLKELKVPNVITSDVKLYKDKPIALFSYIHGNILKEESIKINHILEIIEFLKELHSVKNIDIKSKNIYELNNLKSMIESIEDLEKKEKFECRFELVKDMNFSYNCVIHGDLFPDNVKFENNNLSGVFDFVNSCYFDKYFDLAVVVISWCTKDFKLDLEFLNKVLKAYDSDLNFNKIKSYLLYASLYYATQRYVCTNNMKRYQDMLEIFDNVKALENA